ncbi:hypothetical protein ACFONC_03100 [Luteimonas soli]|uniref:Zinc-ribbon domain-containing protein n=1 Tax=Luteimonas soli TaxID=1648966 RepID=A0ABV7XG91_9GAMM
MWTAAQLARLGKVYDHELASELGVNAETVRKERQRRGIKPLRVAAAKHRQVDRLVGKLPDVEIAARLGVSAAVVYRRRKAVGAARGEPIESPRVPRRVWTLQEARAVAVEHGGTCISRKTGSVLRWRCAEGHVFEATAHRVIRRRQWCGRCSGQVKD